MNDFGIIIAATPVIFLTIAAIQFWRNRRIIRKMQNIWMNYH
jgi:hypothetical protein